MSRLDQPPRAPFRLLPLLLAVLGLAMMPWLTQWYQSGVLARRRDPGPPHRRIVPGPLAPREPVVARRGGMGRRAHRRRTPERSRPADVPEQTHVEIGRHPGAGPGGGLKVRRRRAAADEP